MARSYINQLNPPPDEATHNREIVIIQREGEENVALIAADELAGLMETAHLLRSPANAKRLLSAQAHVQQYSLTNSEITAMHPAKQEALQTIARLPEDVDMEEIMYRLYVLEKIRKGQEDVAQGRTTTIDDLKREIEQW